MTNELEERRKKATIKAIPRKHAGKVVEPYKILDRLIKEVSDFAPLKKAAFCIAWKSGWRCDKDGILKRAQIRKASEVEREVYGEFDFVLLLHKELWQSSSFKGEAREMDVFHELCHAAPDIDDATGEQRVDERDRLCWRLRKHPIQEFPAVIDRYGLEASIGVNEEAVAAVDDEASQAAAQAAENDLDRPIIQQVEKARAARKDAWRAVKVEQLGLAKTLTKKLIDARLETLGLLSDLMAEQGTWWHREVAGVGEGGAEKVSDAMADFWKSHPEFDE